MRDSFVLFTEQKEIINKLSDEQAGKIFKALFDYVSDEDVSMQEDLAMDIVFTSLKQSIDRNTEKWEEIKKKRSEAGKRHSGNQYSQNGTQKTQMEQMEQMEQNGTNGTVNVSVPVPVPVSVPVSVSVVEEEKEKEEAAETATAFYLHNVNPVASEYELQQIQDYENDLPSDLVIYALKIAVEQRKTSLSYIKAILRDWKTKGIVCLKQAMEERLERQNKEPTASSNRFISDTNMAQYGDMSQYYCNL